MLQDAVDSDLRQPPQGRGPRAGARRLVVVGLITALVGAALVTGVLPVKEAAGRPEVAGEAPATATNQQHGISNNSPLLLSDPTDARFVVLANRVDAPDFSCALQVSGDGGRSWIPTNPVPTLPTGADKCYGPEVAFDKSGVLYYLFVGLHGGGNEPMGVFLTTSTDRARTFSPPRQVLGPLNFAARMAIEPDRGPNGRIHLVWLHATSDPGIGAFGPPPNPILTAHSDDGGKTFSEPIQVSDPSRPRAVAPGLTLGPDGAVHVVYVDLQGDARDYHNLEGPVWEGTWSVVLASSRDGGGRFEPGVVVDDQVVPSERPILIFTMPPPAMVAGPGGRVCAAWTDARHGDADVLLRCSADGGRSWDQARRVNDDPIGTGHRQYLPRLSLAAGGRIDAVFYDRRADPAGVLTNVTYTHSEDDGRHFAPSITLSGAPSSAHIGAQYAGPSAEGQFEFGSRLGLLSERSAVLAAWADTRYSKRGTTGQDVFTAEVRLPSARQAGWARVLGAVLGLVGLVCLLAAGFRRRRAPEQESGVAGL